MEKRPGAGGNLHSRGGGTARRSSPLSSQPPNGGSAPTRTEAKVRCSLHQLLERYRHDQGKRARAPATVSVHHTEEAILNGFHTLPLLPCLPLTRLAYCTQVGVRVLVLYLRVHVWSNGQDTLAVAISSHSICMLGDQLGPHSAR